MDINEVPGASKSSDKTGNLMNPKEGLEENRNSLIAKKYAALLKQGLSAREIERQIAEYLLKLDLPMEVKEAAQKAIVDAIKKTADKSVDLQAQTLERILLVLAEAAQKANDAQFNNTDDYRKRFASIQQAVVEKYFAQATAGNEMMTSIGALSMAAGALFSAFGNPEKGAELVDLGQEWINTYSAKTLKLKENLENEIYGPDAVQIARGTKGNKALGDSIHGRVGDLDDYSRDVDGKLELDHILKRIDDIVKNPFDPKYEGEKFSTDDSYSKGIPAGGPVKDHKADTVKPYSPADVRRYAAAALAPSKWDPTIAAAAEKISKETGISTSILAMEAKIRIGPESGGNPNAWNGGKGAKGEDAYGLMQLTPDTAKQYGVTNIKDPQQNIEGGLRFIAHIIKKYGRENVDLYYYGGEGQKDHGPNTRQYVENLGAVRTLLPKEGFEIAQASSEPKKEPSKKQADEKKETASVLPPFAAVAGLDNQIPGTDTRGLKTDAGALLARNDENKPKEGKVGDPSSTAQNDQRYPLIVGAPAPSGGFTGT